MVRDPVNRTRIAHARVGFQIVDSHTPSWPRRYARVAAVHPEFAPSFACGCKVDGYYQCLFLWNGCGLLCQADWRGESSNCYLWLGGRSNDKAWSLPKPKILRHLTAVCCRSWMFRTHSDPSSLSRFDTSWPSLPRN